MDVLEYDLKTLRTTARWALLAIAYAIDAAIAEAVKAERERVRRWRLTAKIGYYETGSDPASPSPTPSAGNP